MEEQQRDKYIRFADKNLADSIKHQMKSIDNMKMYETENYMIYSIGVPSTDAHLNGALCLNDDYAEEMLDKAENFFNDLGLDYTVWVRDHADYKLEKILKHKGLSPKRRPGSAVMAIDERIRVAELADGFKVKVVNDRHDIRDFAKVTKEAFDKSQDEIDRMYETEETIVADNMMAFLIYKDDEPVSSVLTMLSDEAAGVYWVGTIESARGQGLGSYIAQIATNAGFDSGKSPVILQASEAGERVYTKLGYETITRYRTYTIKKR